VLMVCRMRQSVGCCVLGVAEKLGRENTDCTRGQYISRSLCKGWQSIVRVKQVLLVPVAHILIIPAEDAHIWVVPSSRTETRREVGAALDVLACPTDRKKDARRVFFTVQERILKVE
jgi:hypothetical protein